MSLSVDGVLCSTVFRSSSPVTTISRYFVSALTPGHSRNGFYPITLVAAGGDNLTVVLRCAVAYEGPDIVLGLDWKASIRELLAGSAYSTRFDPFQAYLGSVPQDGLILSPSPAAEAHSLSPASQLLELNPEFCTPINVPTRVRAFPPVPLSPTPLSRTPVNAPTRLRRPDLLSSESEDSSRDDDNDYESEHDAPSEPDTDSGDQRWLDPDMIAPPMPIDEDDPHNGEYSTLLIEPQCIEPDPESMEDVLVMCKVRRSELLSGKAKKKPPRRAMAHKNYLGPVPPELKDLSVVEETIIARCRSKCWIIQMRELDDREFPNVQRGFKGHIIVYPQRPSAIAATLPPSIEEISTPICVVFVGSKPPSLEWIQTKAKPLIRKERVMKALDWLSTHNHLYKDVFIDRTVLTFRRPW
ncbi:hypothetical protein B0H13DRAFT_2681979 [Mycena leptocephala]|nr:hypothetical protein B0H13DRAFT_2681979 [Mycena leptocephala]